MTLTPDVKVKGHDLDPRFQGCDLDSKVKGHDQGHLHWCEKPSGGRDILTPTSTTTCTPARDEVLPLPLLLVRVI